MTWYHQRRYGVLSIGVTLCALPIAILPVSAAAPAPPADVLSGRWKVSRSCQTICVNPAPVVRTVRHLQGHVYATDGQPRQILYQIGMQVLVHSAADSLLLTIDPRGRLMTGRGVGVDGSTFTTTWRCITPRRSPAATQRADPARMAADGPAQAPMAMEAC